MDEQRNREIYDETIHALRQQTRPSVLFRPTLTVDGNQYCAMYGADLMSGIAGFGDTAEDAMRDFDKNWVEQKRRWKETQQMSKLDCDCGRKTHNLLSCGVPLPDYRNQKVDVERGKAERDGFLQGVAWAAQILITMHDQPGFAFDLLKEAGANVEALAAAGTDEYDLSAIRKSIAKEKGE